MSTKRRIGPLLLLGAASLMAASAAHAANTVAWVNWSSGVGGPDGSAAGTIDLGAPGPDAADIGVSYSGEVAFIQTNNSGTNYWTGNPSPYTSAAVANAPLTVDIIALSLATTKTLTFTAPVDNLFFAVVSLNGNGYRFNEDFSIESFNCGYWGCGSLSKQDNGDGTFSLIGSGEPHGVIRFNRAVSSITWTSLTNEYWNGFTVGTYGAAPVPEPAVWALWAGGLAAFAGTRRLRGR
jgi:hypothetical protein